MKNVTRYKQISTSYTEVYYNNEFLGGVEYKVMCKRWFIKPSFTLLSFDTNFLNKEFYDSVDAGRTLVELWEKTNHMHSYFSDDNEFFDDFFDNVPVD
jgi:hypothetical protein